MAEAQTNRVSIAALLDEVRELITDARDTGENPRYLLLPADPFDAVRVVKAADIERGQPPLVLGLEIVRADDPKMPAKVF